MKVFFFVSQSDLGLDPPLIDVLFYVSVTVIKMDEDIKMRYIGCFLDSQQRALPFKSILDADSLTLDETFISKCIETCKTGNHPYAGLQYRKECYCGQNYNMHGKAAESDCNELCSDGSGECGGSWRNSVYKTGNYALPLLLIKRHFFQG